MEFSAEESIEKEELTDDVDDEDDLGEDIEDDQVVTKASTAYDAAGTRQAVLQTYCAPCLVLALTSQISAKYNQKKLLSLTKIRLLEWCSGSTFTWHVKGCWFGPQPGHGEITLRVYSQ